MLQEKYLPVPLMKLEGAAATNGTAEGWVYGSKVLASGLKINLYNYIRKTFPTLDKI